MFLILVLMQILHCGRSNTILAYCTPADQLLGLQWSDTLHHRFRQTVAICLVLSDDHQTIVRCLLDVPPNICQLPLDIYQTGTTYTPNMYHTPTRHILYHMYTRCLPDIYQTSTRYLSDVWYMSGVNVVLVWQMSGWSWQVSGGASDRHLTIIWQGAQDK